MSIGIDIVHTPRVADLMEDENAVRNTFNPDEYTDDVASLAGVLAAKEAYFKAKGAKQDWLSVTVDHDESGRPVITAEDDDHVHVSITHDDEYAAAVVFIE